ncbi:hypothetical protein MRB53_040323 [Persea americana]|nr:hypothetical protein MRB53_040323 [Persea americana]
MTRPTLLPVQHRPFRKIPVNNALAARWGCCRTVWSTLSLTIDASSAPYSECCSSTDSSVSRSASSPLMSSPESARKLSSWPMSSSSPLTVRSSALSSPTGKGSRALMGPIVFLLHKSHALARAPSTKTLTQDVTIPRPTFPDELTAAQAGPCFSVLSFQSLRKANKAVFAATSCGFIGVRDVRLRAPNDAPCRPGHGHNFALGRCRGVLVLVADRTCSLGQKSEFSARLQIVVHAAVPTTLESGCYLPPRSGQPSAPSADAYKRQQEEQKLGERVPHKLSVKVFERDFSANLIRGRREPKTKYAVEDCAVSTIVQEDEKRYEGGCRVRRGEH